MDHLVIGDTHDNPEEPKDRFEWAGRYALEHQVEKVMQGWDWSSIDSLCSYDKGKRKFEGRSYSRDVKSCHAALTAFNRPIDEYNHKRRMNRKGIYLPEKHLFLGNHENRVNKAVEYNASELEGLMDLSDLGHADFGWQVHPFLKAVDIDGILYSHYFTSGVKGYAIGGQHSAYRAMKEKMQSCTSFHSHRLSVFPQHLHDGTRQWGMVAGCYFTHWEDYAGPDNNNWDRGIVHKRRVKNGDYDFEWISIEELERRYG